MENRTLLKELGAALDEAFTTYGENLRKGNR